MNINYLKVIKFFKKYIGKNFVGYELEAHIQSYDFRTAGHLRDELVQQVKFRCYRSQAATTNQYSGTAGDSGTCHSAFQGADCHVKIWASVTTLSTFLQEIPEILKPEIRI